MKTAEQQLQKAQKLDPTAKLYRYSDGEFKIVTITWTDFYDSRGVCTAHLNNTGTTIGDSDMSPGDIIHASDDGMIVLEEV